jgi:hypothetical protein
MGYVGHYRVLSLWYDTQSVEIDRGNVPKGSEPAASILRFWLVPAR